MLKYYRKDLKSSLVEREKYLTRPGYNLYDGVLLKTCNRIEVYYGKGRIPRNIAEHLFRVTAGLESALIGETAIQGQVKRAYIESSLRNNLSKELHLLFQNALKVGKRIRRETNISKGAMSYSQAVLEILKQDKINIKKARILIIGVNNLNCDVVKYLVRKGSSTIFVANRNYKKAHELGKQLGCLAINYNYFYEKLTEIDILVSATSAPHLIVKSEKFRAKQNIIMFDLAVPRDIAPDLAILPNIKLYNIEDIEKRVSDNQLTREKEIILAEAIISEELIRFYGKN